MKKYLYWVVVLFFLMIGVMKYISEPQWVFDVKDYLMGTPIYVRIVIVILCAGLLYYLYPYKKKK